MDMTVDEIICQLDDLMEAMSYHDRLLIALDLAQHLRDELLQHADEDDE